MDFFWKPIETEPVPFDTNLEGSVSAKISVEPTVEFLVYGLAGVGASIIPSAEMKLVKQAGSEPLEAELNFDLALEMAPVGIAFSVLDERLRPVLTRSLARKEIDLLELTDRLTAALFENKETDTYTVERVYTPGGTSGNLRQSHLTYGGNPIPGATGSTLEVPVAAYPEYFGVEGIDGVTGQVFASEVDYLPVGHLPEDFVSIPAGGFLMGDSFAEGWYAGGDNELPVREVNVDRFYMMSTEVTKQEWDRVRSWANLNGYTDLRIGLSKGMDHPVHTVSWHDAVKWCNARSEMEGLEPCYSYAGEIYRVGEFDVVSEKNRNGYRLPTEEEWEKAARGGLVGKRFPWGDTITHNHANYWSKNARWLRYDTSTTRGHHPDFATGAKPYTSKVRSFAPNGYGLYDMVGNLWELCDNRAIRGGTWGIAADHLRCSHRGGVTWAPPQGADHTGFRIVRK